MRTLENLLNTFSSEINFNKIRNPCPCVGFLHFTLFNADLGFLVPKPRNLLDRQHFKSFLKSQLKIKCVMVIKPY